MELEHILKQLRHIEPDEAYSLRSRSILMATLPSDERPSFSPWQVITHSLQFGSAVAMAGMLILLVLGGFSTWRFLSPFRLTSLDPAGLRAEAQAVDVQLEMTKLNYAAPKIAETMAVTAEPEPEPETPDQIEAKAPAKAQAEAEAKDLGIVPATTSTDSETNVDDVLSELAE
jgi:hypothetical protein